MIVRTATMIPPQAGSYSEVSAEKTISSTDSTREDSVPTTPSHPELIARQLDDIHTYYSSNPMSIKFKLKF